MERLERMNAIEPRIAALTVTVALAVTSLLACSDAGRPEEQTGTTTSAATTKTTAGSGTAAEYVPASGSTSDLLIGKKPDIAPFEHKPLTATTTACVRSNMAKVSFLRAGEVEREVTHSCFPYLCDGGGPFTVGRTPTNTCTTTCATSADCSPGAGCKDGACVQRSTYCSPSGLTSRSTTGERELCSGYYCQEVSGLCRTTCTKTTECTPGWACETEIGKCVEVNSNQPWIVALMAKEAAMP